MAWTLRKKILIGYGIALTLMAVILVLALANLFVLGKASNAILTENYKSILAADNMIGAIERQDSAILLLMLGYGDEGLKQFREYESQFLQWFGRAKDNITVEGEENIVNTIETGYSSYLVNFSELRLVYETDPVKSAGVYHGTVLPSFKLVRDECIRLREINQNTMSNASDRAGNIANTAIWSMAIISIIAISVGLGFSLFLSNLLVRPLQQIVKATQRIGGGDYDVEIPIDSTDELGILASQFNTMVSKVKAYNDLNIEQIMTEKRKSDAIIRSIDDGLVVIDAESRIVNMNPAAVKIFNIELDNAQDRHFLEIVKSDELFEYVKQTVESGNPPKIEEGKDIFTIQRNESKQYYQFSISPVLAKGGSMLGVVMLLRDVTELKELDRLKSEFVMMASHELRTPLTSIIMSVDLLIEKAEKKLDHNEEQLLSTAHEELQRLKALVNDLLDLSRIESGKVEMEFDKISVSKLFEKAIVVFKNQADKQSVELSWKEKDVLPQIKADPNKITWVLTNLISNALRYVHDGGHIRLFAERLGPQLHISVSDNGVGIPYEYQSRIFDKFMQVKGDSTPGGSGLGLAICKEIIRAHGGTIWVDSTPGQGSTFTFTLPVAE